MKTLYILFILLVAITVQAEEKPSLIIFSGPNCVHCDRLKADIDGKNKDKTLSIYVKNNIEHVWKVDISTRYGKELKKVYQIGNSIPVTVVGKMNENSSFWVWKKIVGYSNPTEFIKDLK